MAQDSKPSRPNQQPPHPSEMDNERWKTSPSTETDADRGTNAEIERKHRIEENAPRVRQTRRGHAVVSDDDES